MDEKEDYEKEIQIWMQEKCLRPLHRETKGIVPLMVVKQKPKKKVRPVLDFQEFGHFIMCHTSYNEVCAEWRCKNSHFVLLDLRVDNLQTIKAYGPSKLFASVIERRSVRAEAASFHTATVCCPRTRYATRCVFFVEDIQINEDVVSQEAVELLRTFPAVVFSRYLL